MAAARCLLQMRGLQTFSNIKRTALRGAWLRQCSRQINTAQRTAVGRGRRFLQYALAIPFIPVVHAFWGKKEIPASVADAPRQDPDKALIDQADLLYTENKISELYELLSDQKDSRNADVQWRIGRAAYEHRKTEANAEIKKKLLYEAFDHVKIALDLDDNSFAAHKWYAILLDSVGEVEGVKQRITNAFLVKDHFLRAIELNPKDATSVHLLGYWCFLFADMPWYQRKIAAVIFASPPTSSYDEALGYFTKAESIEPNFYSKNLMMIGKTYLRLGDKEKAVFHLKLARDYKVITEDDKASHKEAVELLQSLGVKDA